MIKIATDLDQSKKLAEILPLESADMVYIMYSNGEKPQNGDANLSTVYESNDNKWYWIDIIDESWDMRIGEDIPAWSLAALLGVLPEPYQLTSNKEGKVQLILIHHLEKDYYDNPVDACYEMILKLNELKLL